ncbi:MAG: ABC transporter ATP-binding protein [Acidobacteriota bacterium]|nr:ABC transporter ATP-binding protein [Acidobacteriota bacterium]
MREDMILEARGLARRFGRVAAVTSADLEVRAGGITALLGENGAGKTTTLRMLLGFLRPQAGSFSCRAGRIGYVPDAPVVFSWARGWDLLELTARRHGLSDRRLLAAAESLCGRLAFDPGLLKRRVMTYSTGNRKKFAYLQSLVFSPDLLVADEPFSGLDPVSVVRLREILITLRKEGASVFLSSHILSEMEKICDAVIILRRGRTVFQADFRRFREGHVFVRAKAGRAVAAFPPGSIFLSRDRGEAVDIILRKSAWDDYLSRDGTGRDGFTPEPLDLEKLFLFFAD